MKILVFAVIISCSFFIGCSTKNINGNIGEGVVIGNYRVTIEEAILAKKLVRVRPDILLNGIYNYDSSLENEKNKDLENLYNPYSALAWSWNSTKPFILPTKGDGFLVLKINVKDISKLGEQTNRINLLFSELTEANGKINLSAVRLSPMSNASTAIEEVGELIYNYDENISSHHNISINERNYYLPFEISNELLQKELYLKLDEKNSIRIKNNGLSTDIKYSYEKFSKLNW